MALTVITAGFGECSRKLKTLNLCAVTTMRPGSPTPCPGPDRLVSYRALMKTAGGILPLNPAGQRCGQFGAVSEGCAASEISSAKR